MLRAIAILLLMYLLASPFTTLIALDLRDTEWTNVGTYLWWLFGWVIWAAGGLTALWVVGSRK